MLHSGRGAVCSAQVFENGASFVVVSFDAAAAEEEGDLTGYMNELARLNSVPGSWQLCKSTANWGQLQVPPTSQNVCFALARAPCSNLKAVATQKCWTSAEVLHGAPLTANLPFNVLEASLTAERAPKLSVSGITWSERCVCTGRFVCSSDPIQGHAPPSFRDLHTLAAWSMYTKLK